MSGRISNSSRGSKDSYKVEENSHISRREVRDNQSLHVDPTPPGSVASNYSTAPEDYDDEEDFDQLTLAVRTFRETDMQRHKKLLHNLTHQDEIIHSKNQEIHELIKEVDQLKEDHASELHKLEALAKQNHALALKLRSAHERYSAKTEEMEQEIVRYRDEFEEIDHTITNLVNNFLQMRETMHERFKALFESSSVLESTREREPSTGIA